MVERFTGVVDGALGGFGVPRELLALFRQLLRESGVTAIYVTHEPREAAALGDRVAVLEQGRVVQMGTAAELSAQPATSFVRVVVEELAYGCGSRSFDPNAAGNPPTDVEGK